MKYQGTRHVGSKDMVTYSGTHLLWTPWEPGLSVLYREVSSFQEYIYIKKAQVLVRKHVWDIAKSP